MQASPAVRSSICVSFDIETTLSLTYILIFFNKYKGTVILSFLVSFIGSDVKKSKNKWWICYLLLVFVYYTWNMNVSLYNWLDVTSKHETDRIPTIFLRVKLHMH